MKHWSDAYPTLALARTAAKGIVEPVDILKRVPLPPGHQFGARWEVVDSPSFTNCPWCGARGLDFDETPMPPDYCHHNE